MLNEKDLRIGNLILFNDDNNTACTIESIKRDFDDEPYSVEIKFKDGMFSDVNIEDIKPIALTSEWLLNLGFTFSEAFKDHFYKHIEGQKLFSVFPFSTKPFCRITEGDFAVYNMPCRFIHQLQNLYFALTGKELTVKEIANAN